MLHSVLPKPDVLIAGAGIIGLSLALELDARGAKVVVLERDTALAHASSRAAGMLAQNDPHNRPELGSLSALSIQLYPDFLARIKKLGDAEVPLHTTHALQALDDKRVTSLDPLSAEELRGHAPFLAPGDLQFGRLLEHSLDPRELCAALLLAVRASGVVLHEGTTFESVAEREAGGLCVKTSRGDISPGKMIHTQGPWAGAPVRPVKGQMLLVKLPPSLPLREVVRGAGIYIVPRTSGERAGCAVIGASVEHAGFDEQTNAATEASLRARAALLLPALGDAATAPTISTWAGLRPGTPDDLPLLGSLAAEHQFIAAGHYRNGILLAPATARVMADVVEGKSPELSLQAFAPARFS